MPMKTLIIYASVHHKNTEKIAKIIAEELDAELVKAPLKDDIDVSKYDLIGLGSGIYMGSFSIPIFQAIDKMIGFQGKKVFIFSTSGMRSSFFNPFEKKIVNKIKDKGGEVVGKFNCLGLNTYGPVGWIGGMNKGRPNDKDVAEAILFARGLES